MASEPGVSFWERLSIAIKAFLRALWQFRYTLIVLPIVGWFAIRKLEPLLAFVLGAFGGYFQGFVERCASNYAQLMQSATDTKERRPLPRNGYCALALRRQFLRLGNRAPASTGPASE